MRRLPPTASIIFIVGGFAVACGLIGAAVILLVTR